MPITIPLDVFDVLWGAGSAIVTPVAGAPVTSVVQWDQEEEGPAAQVVGAGAAIALNRRVVAAVKREDVPTLPVGSTIAGGPENNIRTWRVVSVAPDPHYHVCTVV